MFFSASIVRRRPLWHAGALGPGRSSKRFVGKAFPLELAQFSKARFSFRETVAGNFGCAVKRSMRNVGAPESLTRAGVVEFQKSFVENLRRTDRESFERKRRPKRPSHAEERA